MNINLPAVLIKRCVILTFAITLAIITSDQAKAQTLRYDFIEASGNNETLATIELASLPAAPADILSITFTQFGEAIFGIGPTSYSNPMFNAGNSAFVDDGAGGLQGNNNLGGGQLADSTPPSSSLEVEMSNGGRVFLIEPTNLVGRDRLAFISEGRGVGGSEVRVGRDGDFRLATSVPEPNAASLLLLSSTLMTCFRRRKQSVCG